MMIYNLNNQPKNQVYDLCLDELNKCHQGISSTIDKGVENRELALFLLIGAAIGTASDALRQYQNKYYVGVLQSARYILEVQSLVEYFIAAKCPDDEIKKWFKGEFIETRLKKKTEEKLTEVIKNKVIIPFKGVPEQWLVGREKSVQKIFGILSLFSHPTIHSTKGLQACDFGNLILDPVVEIFTDTQRVVFTPQDSVAGMKLSEFRVYFKTSSKEERESEPDASGERR